MNKPLKITIAVLVGLGLIILLMPSYLRTALVYQKPGIDDYTIFHNRTLKASHPIPWGKDSLFGKLKIPRTHEDSFFKFDPVALILVKDGKLLHEEYFHGHTDEMISGSFSMAKSVVALLVGAAIDDGFIEDVHQPISDFIPSFAISQHDVTVYDLLTMTSGLDWDEEYAAAFSITTKAYYGNDLKKLLKPIGVSSPPGSVFNYTSGTTQLLAFILGKATGMHISDYASKKIWSKIGAEQDALWSLDQEDGMEKAYCCFNSTARDFARLGQLVLNNGLWEGKQIISPEYIQQLTTPISHIRDKYGKPTDYYGYQTWILQHEGMQIPYFRGILGQYIFIFPEMDAVMVRLGHKRSDYRINNTPSDILIYADMFMDMWQAMDLQTE